MCNFNSIIEEPRKRGVIMTGKHKEVLLTEEGLENLKKEYKILIKEKRPAIIADIKEARSLGDLAENAEYHSAREEQAKLEAKIRDIEYMIENVTLIKEGGHNKIGIGSTVVIEYLEDESEEEYTIVGSLEADPFNNKISNESPIAIAILGHKEEDVVEVESPNGSYKVKIAKIA